MNTERYRYIKDLGSGGSGCAKLVYDRHLGIKKVIKEVTLNSPDQIEAFLRETQTLKAVKHPGIPVITDQWVDCNTGFFVMDYCDGVSLDSYVRTTHHLSVDKSLAIFVELAQIVSLLHDSSPRIIHGDLKPENLIISANGIHLLDFGTAYFENNCSHTSPALAFTYGYASPSLLSGNQPSIESDIYALGMIFFFMLTGHDVREFPDKHIGLEDFPDEYSSELKRIFSNCLEGYHHISELIKEINNYRADNSINLASIQARKIKNDIFASPFNKLYRFIKHKLINLFKTSNHYVRLEHILLTDGGHLLFALLIGLCLGILFEMKYPVYGAEPASISNYKNKPLSLSLQTKAGENFLLKENCMFEDSLFPGIMISDRKLCDDGIYSILVSVSAPSGNQYSRRFDYNKVSHQ